MAGAPIGNQNAKKYKDEKELEQLINKYFEECDKKNKPYTMSGLAYALDIDRTTLINYGKDELFSTLIKNAKKRVQKQMEENALMGKANATFSIFSLKNNYGWKDSVETKVETNVDNITPLINMLMNNNESKKDGNN